jgi:hypothetical protein
MMWRAFFSVAMFDSSHSSSIRGSAEPDSVEQLCLRDSRSVAAYHARKLGALRAFLNQTRRHSHLDGVSPEAFENASKLAL